MKDAEYQKQKGRIDKLLEKWVAPLGLKWWDTQFIYEREAASGQPQGYGTTAARCESNWHYRTAMVTFFLSEITELPNDELERIVVHELCHIFVAPLESFETDRERQITEYTVEGICRAFLYYDGHMQEQVKEASKRKVKVNG